MQERRDFSVKNVQILFGRNGQNRTAADRIRLQGTNRGGHRSARHRRYPLNSKKETAPQVLANREGMSRITAEQKKKR
jgi:hypothetical protein